MAKIDVKGTSATVYSDGEKDSISLTNMLKAKDGDFFISDWLRNRNTVEFLSIWGQEHNPALNYGGFAAIEGAVGISRRSVAGRKIAMNGMALLPNPSLVMQVEFGSGMPSIFAAMRTL
jgi:hypothetical protein